MGAVPGHIIHMYGDGGGVKRAIFCKRNPIVLRT